METNLTNSDKSNDLTRTYRLINVSGYVDDNMPVTTLWDGEDIYYYCDFEFANFDFGEDAEKELARCNEYIKEREEAGDFQEGRVKAKIWVKTEYIPECILSLLRSERLWWKYSGNDQANTTKLDAGVLFLESIIWNIKEGDIVEAIECANGEVDLNADYITILRQISPYLAVNLIDKYGKHSDYYDGNATCYITK
jgi:hypothetical protein